MTPFKLKIITPEKTFFEGETEQIIARTASGNIGILAGHAPYVANIVSSPFQIKLDGQFKTAAISGGLIKVSAEGVTVVTSAVEWADEIDVARAERAKAEAERKIKENASQKEFERAEQKLRRAMNRLVVAGKK
ncbi:ATP synthase F1 subunit epsilon [Ruminococcus sp.]|uniref:ATP synthase F1 subunit epsilon n=1 Tax=Ruminococcus sp. TaxID=41978 RepID=UPI0025D26DBE|nr:ATP synthase F1 subunit epsilon [Ruminococcus sp.]